MHRSRILDWAEKRIKLRHKVPGLRCKLSFPGLLGWFKPTLRVDCLDFNRYGMAALSTVPLKENSLVSLHFKGKYIVQSNVKASVQSCISTSEGYRVSLVFSYAKDSKYYSRRIDNALSRIEHIYSKQ